VQTLSFHCLHCLRVLCFGAVFFTKVFLQPYVGNAGRQSAIAKFIVWQRCEMKVQRIHGRLIEIHAGPR
jgi:hypothetical protein